MKLNFDEQAFGKLLFFIIISLCYVVLPTELHAQNVGKILKEANKYYEAGAFDQAIELYRDVLLEDNSLEAKEKLAECYRQISDYEKAAYWYEQIITLVPDKPQYQLHYARALQSNGKCEEAKKWFLAYSKFDKLGEVLATSCDRQTEFNKNKTKYELALLSINSPESDFGPMVHEDGLIFCSNRKEIGKNRGSVLNRSVVRPNYTDIFYAKKQLGNAYTPPEKLKGAINSNYNDGPVSFGPDRRTVFFTRNQYYKGKKRESLEGSVKLAIFSSTKDENEKWSSVTDFSHNNREYSVAHPALSADGQKLYFISDKFGGHGQTDIYLSVKLDSIWSEPQNLGTTINTAGNEVFPYVHTDGTLYFASNGHPGLGGLDIFYTQFKNGKWSKPVNMGSPINSSYDDFSVSLTSNKDIGYFASNRKGGFGKDDVYKFALKGAIEATSPSARNVNIIVQQPPLVNNLLDKDIGLEKIYFLPDDWALLPETKQTLEKLIAYLYENPAMTVEIGSHTDSRGDPYHNLELSGRRANSIREYLIVEKAIPHSRLVAKGYGERRLLNNCYDGVECDEVQHEENNRIEIALLNIDGKRINRVQPLGFGLKERKNTNLEEKPIDINQDVIESSPSKDAATIPSTEIELEEDVDILPSSRLNYKVFLGPYKGVDNDTYYTFAELNTGIDLKYTEKGMMVVLGPFDTIVEAEAYQQRAKELGGKKTKIVVFRGPLKTDLSVKKLKRQGVK